MHAHTQTHTHKHTHAHTNTHTYTHIHTQGVADQALMSLNGATLVPYLQGWPEPYIYGLYMIYGIFHRDFIRPLEARIGDNYFNL